MTPRRRRRRARQGRGALPRRGARRARARGGRRGAGHRLGIARRLGRDRPRAPASRCSRSRRPTSATAARATSAPSARAREIVAFLTQDATPVPGWLAALPRGVRARRRASAPRSARICRGRTRQPDDRARADRVLRDVRRRRRRAARVRARATRRSSPTSTRRTAGVLGGDPLRRRPVQRGPGVRPRAGRAPGVAEGLRAASRRCCTRTTTRRSSSCAATSTSTAGCARRSGTSSGSACARRCATSAGSSRATGAGCASRACPRRRVTRWTGRSVVHHTGRKVFSALGSRGQPPARARPARALARGPRRRRRAARSPRRRCRTCRPRRTSRRGTRRTATRRSSACCGTGRRRCSTRCPGMADRERLHVAFAIPPFSVGSGGHNIIFQLVLRLERMGHTCSIWLHDPFDQHARRRADAPRQRSSSTSRPCRRPCSRGFGDWYGADVAVATGWQTVFPLLEQHGVRARAYLINDHEPEFYPTSVESIWATETYRQGLYGIAGEPVAARPVHRPLRRRGRARSSTAWTMTSTTRGRSPGATTRSSSTPAR